MDFGEKILRKIDVERGFVSNSKEFNKIEKWWNGTVPNEISFTDLYGEAEIKKDLITISKIENLPEYRIKNDEEIAAESIIKEAIHDIGWLGDENISASSCSKFDDRRNKLDVIATMVDEDDENNFHLGIDVTCGQSDIVSRKLDSILDNLDREQLTETKYHSNEDFPDDRGKIILPRVIIALNRESVKNIQNKFVENRRELVNDPIQLEILRKIRLQLTYQAVYLIKRFFQPSFESWENSDEILRIINEKSNDANINKTRWFSSLEKIGKVLERIIDVEKQKNLSGIKPTQEVNPSVYRFEDDLKKIPEVWSRHLAT